MMKEFLDAIGVDGPIAVSGFMGGLVNIFWHRSISPFDVTGALVTGTTAAIYVAGPLATISHLPPGLIGFVFGVGGMPLLIPLIAMIRRKVFGNGEAAIPPA